MWAPIGAEMCMFRSSENTPKPVPDLVLDQFLKILNSLRLNTSWYPRTVVSCTSC